MPAALAAANTASVPAVVFTSPEIGSCHGCRPRGVEHLYCPAPSSRPRRAAAESLTLSAPRMPCAPGS